MKNLYLLPTSNPSKIGYHSDIIKEGRWDYAPNFGFSEFNKDFNFRHNPYNIYITNNSEELKEGWFIDTDNNKLCHTDKNLIVTIEKVKRCKNVILTTDTDLIKDGVQAIDNEFLESFVKNPSCEKVEIEDFPMTEKYNSKGEYIHRSYWVSKIIIPKEEPKTGYVKSETKILGVEFTLEDGSKQFVPNLKEEPKALTKLEIAKNIAAIGIGKEEQERSITIVDVSKQENNLEEAAEREIKFLSPFQDDELYKKGFEEGAKWQQEKSYSEEDIREAFFSGCQSERQFKPRIKCWEEWFEQFKTKQNKQ